MKPRRIEMGKLTVLDGGLFTTIQDKGRSGYRKYGVPSSGVMDISAYKKANFLAGNSKNAPVLECTLKGGKYQFNTDATIAITGALMNPGINDNEIGMNTSVKVRAGETLELGFAKKGCRAYVAIRGSWDIDKVMGSCSTFTLGKFGGLNGTPLKKGDQISWQEIPESLEPRTLQNDGIPYYSSKITIEFIPGPEWDQLNDQEKDKFLNSSFRVSSKSNRMGIRLESEKPIVMNQVDMKSSGVIPGIIQIPPNGLPIILMKDGQTVGGYPRIGKILDIHLNRIAQVPINGTIKFKEVKDFI